MHLSCTWPSGRYGRATELPLRARAAEQSPGRSCPPRPGTQGQSALAEGVAGSVPRATQAGVLAVAAPWRVRPQPSALGPGAAAASAHRHAQQVLTGVGAAIGTEPREARAG